MPTPPQTEADIAERVVGSTEAVQQIGRLGLNIDCGDTPWEMQQGNILRYRCHTGHAFTADGLLRESQDQLEETLWVALRMMEERKNLLSSMTSRGEGLWSIQQEERVEKIKRHVNRLREFLLNGAAGEGRAGDNPQAST